MLNRKSADKFLNLMDEAHDASQEHHGRMRHELAIYNNRSAYIDGTSIANVSPLTHESLNPEI